MTVAPPNPPSSPPGPSAPPPRRSRGSTAILLGLTGTMLGLFLASIALVAYLLSGSGAGKVADDSFLAITLGSDVTDAPAQGGLVLDPEDIPPILTQVAGAIRHAKDDQRIAGLYLVLDSPAVGFAGTQELRDAIAAFRSAGKPCVVYSESFTTGSYYLASACDRIVVPPTGVGLVTGLAVSTTYYAGLFEKWGIKAELLHVGDFKSAVEPYTRKEPSEPASQAMNALLDSLWGRWISGVADGRGKTAEEVQAWVDHPSMSPKSLIAAGMVDAAAFPDQVRGHVLQAKDDGWVDALTQPVSDDDDTIKKHFTKLSDYLAGMEADSGGGVFGGKKKIAVLYAEGAIVDGEASGGLFGGESVIADRTINKVLDQIRKDDDVAALVLRVDSPGGSGLSSDLIWRGLMRVKATGKPVVVSMGNYAASGGYYISTAGDYVVAEPSTLTGSIGVFGGKITFGGIYPWMGLTETTYKRGANSDLLSTTEPFTDEGRAAYQGFLDDFYEQFLARVSDARHLTRDQVHEIAQGRVWTGEQALDRKLVDELGGLDVALAKAAELGKVDDYTVERWPKAKSFVEQIVEQMQSPSSSAPRIEIPGVDPKVVDDVLTLDAILDGGAAALLPGNLRIE